MKVELNSRQLLEVMQCIRIGIHQDERDATQQTGHDAKEAFRHSAEFRRAILAVFERANRS